MTTQETTTPVERDRTNLYMPREVKNRLKAAAEYCGYGPQQTNKFIMKMIDVVEAMPIMFKK